MTQTKRPPRKPGQFNCIEELDMLHELVERGPDFHTIERIEIRHTQNRDEGLTIEGSLSQ